MKYLILISVLFCYAVNSALTADLHNKTISCNETVTNLRNEVVNLATDCSSKPCITKCCGINEIIIYNPALKTFTCTEVTTELKHEFKNWNITLDYSDIPLYKSDFKEELEISSLKFYEDFNVVQMKALVDNNCGKIWLGKNKAQVLDNGKFVLDMKHVSAKRWAIVEHQYFCVERVVGNFSRKYKGAYGYRYMKKQASHTEIEKKNVKLEFTRVATLISSFFLVLVLLVYCALPQLRNLAGMLLMAYVATLLIAYLTKAITSFIVIETKQCMILFPIIYFLFQSSFLWLNIMSFDMWYTFRCIRLNRLIHRHGETSKFIRYGLYAWGVAATMTIIAVIIDNSSLTNWPNVLKPGFSVCFNNEDATLRYHYAPIGVVTLLNIVLFLMTVDNIRLINKGLKDFSCSSNTKNNKMRFYLYIRMSLLMGVSWMLEVLQVLLDDDAVWLYILLNLYNTFIGVAIFVMFVFNMPTLYMLCKRFKIQIKFVQDWKSKSTRTTVSRPSTNKSTISKTRTIDGSELEMCEVSFVENSNKEQVTFI